MLWHIGCSGFHYKHWRGSFYPEDLPERKWLDYYCQFFNTLELNNTFYRFPRVSYLRNWHGTTPSGFLFAVKAPRVITHFRQFNNVTAQLSDFYTAVREGLAEKLGCVLFQLGPRFSYTNERLEKILKNLDNSFLNVVEFRHESWWNEEVYHQLTQKNITFCGMNHPELPKEVINNTPVLYYRLHGAEQLYASNYEGKQLHSIADQITHAGISKEAYIFFNNDINTFAVHNALTLKDIVKSELPG